MSRRIAIDPQLCEGHGLCIELAPEVFQLGQDIAGVNDVVDEHLWEAVDSAVTACPRHAISIIDG
ncbi:MAG: ferredoxin [Mycobacterium sp.]